MSRTKIKKILTIGTIYSPRNNRRLVSSSSSSYDYFGLIAVISTSNPPPNSPKNTTASSISILETPKIYSKDNSPNTTHVSQKLPSH